MSTSLRVRCSAKNSKGKDCGNFAIRGGTVCRSHGGGAPQVKARAAVVAEVFNWGFTDKTVDPGETLLKLVTQSAARAQRYADAMEAKVDELGLEAAMVGDAWGEHGKVGEYIRGLAVMEAQERDRCANFATKAIAAGLNERMVRVAEAQGTMLAAMVTAALAEAALPDEMAQRVKTAIARQVRGLTV